MAKELELNPKKFGSIANHKQEPYIKGALEKNTLELLAICTIALICAAKKRNFPPIIPDDLILITSVGFRTKIS